jgi:hypothetical protein
MRTHGKVEIHLKVAYMDLANQRTAFRFMNGLLCIIILMQKDFNFSMRVQKHLTGSLRQDRTFEILCDQRNCHETDVCLQQFDFSCFTTQLRRATLIFSSKLN